MNSFFMMGYIEKGNAQGFLNVNDMVYWENYIMEEEIPLTELLKKVTSEYANYRVWRLSHSLKEKENGLYVFSNQNKPSLDKKIEDTLSVIFGLPKREESSVVRIINSDKIFGSAQRNKEHMLQSNGILWDIVNNYMVVIGEENKVKLDFYLKQCSNNQKSDGPVKEYKREIKKDLLA